MSSTLKKIIGATVGTPIKPQAVLDKADAKFVTEDNIANAINAALEEAKNSGDFKGEDGDDGVTPTIEISEDGYWIINGVKTEHKAIGADGEDGKDGEDCTADLSGYVTDEELEAMGYITEEDIKNKGYITEDDIPVIADRGVQANYEQNDPNAASYIKNRPFYEEVGVLPDEITSGGLNVSAFPRDPDGSIVPFSNRIVTRDELFADGAEYNVEFYVGYESKSEIIKLKPEFISQESDSGLVVSVPGDIAWYTLYFVYDHTSFSVSEYNGEFQAEGNGIYYYDESNYRQFTLTRLFRESGNVIVTLPNKFLNLKENTDFKELESIAKGANNAISYQSYEEMVGEFNHLADNVYRVGQNIMIVTLNVPDLWISGISPNREPYIPPSSDYDANIVNALSTTGSIQVGYYVLSALESQKVNLTDYVKQDEFLQHIWNANSEIAENAKAISEFVNMTTEPVFLVYERTQDTNVRHHSSAMYLTSGGEKPIPEKHWSRCVIETNYYKDSELVHTQTNRLSELDYHVYSEPDRGVDLAAIEAEIPLADVPNRTSFLAPHLLIIYDVEFFNKYYGYNFPSNGVYLGTTVLDNISTEIPVTYQVQINRINVENLYEIEKLIRGDSVEGFTDLQSDVNTLKVKSNNSVSSEGELRTKIDSLTNDMSTILSSGQREGNTVTFERRATGYDVLFDKQYLQFVSSRVLSLDEIKSSVINVVWHMNPTSNSDLVLDEKNLPAEYMPTETFEYNGEIYAKKITIPEEKMSGESVTKCYDTCVWIIINAEIFNKVHTPSTSFKNGIYLGESRKSYSASFYKATVMSIQFLEDGQKYAKINDGLLLENKEFKEFTESIPSIASYTVRENETVYIPKDGYGVWEVHASSDIPVSVNIEHYASDQGVISISATSAKFKINQYRDTDSSEDEFVDCIFIEFWTLDGKKSNLDFHIENIKNISISNDQQGSTGPYLSAFVHYIKLIPSNECPFVQREE